jgi:hypothetical protein
MGSKRLVDQSLGASEPWSGAFAAWMMTSCVTSTSPTMTDRWFWVAGPRAALRQLEAWSGYPVQFAGQVRSAISQVFVLFAQLV